MKFENTRVYGMDRALLGMRNPLESWNKSDTKYGIKQKSWIQNNEVIIEENNNNVLYIIIGKNDMELAKKLIRAGSEHRKFLRQIMVSVDITAPLYWWKEFDTYKVGTVSNSTSTMHKLATTPIRLECFEIDDFVGDKISLIGMYNNRQYGLETTFVTELIDWLEQLRQLYIETKDNKYWKELIRWLPESWLQKRTITMNYENLLNICSKGQRRFHKLNEWKFSFINWARTLPYAKDFIFIDEI